MLGAFSPVLLRKAGKGLDLGLQTGDFCLFGGYLL